MKSTFLYLYFLLLTCSFAFAQNIANNGSIEQLVSCPNNQAQIDSAFFWSDGSGTSDLYNGCSNIIINSIPKNWMGYQSARTGIGYIGFVSGQVGFTWPNTYTMLKEYPRIEFIQPLIQNTLYNIRCFISNSGKLMSSSTNSIAGDSLGFLFLNQDTTFNDWMDITPLPQVYDTSGFYIDTLNWIEIKGQYLAQGGEKYLIIGDFKRYDLIPNYYITHYVGLNANTFCYYFLDDLAIWPADTVPPPADAGNDTTICRGGKAKLGTHTYSDYIYEWSPSESLSNDSGGVVWASPLITTTYYLLATDDIYTKTLDSVTVFVNNCGQNDTTVCIEQQFVMGNTNNPLWNYQWVPATYLSNDTIGMPLCNPTSDINYQLLITNTNGDTIAIDSTHILVGACHYAQAGRDSLICKGDSLQIGVYGPSYVNYHWSPNYMINDTTVSNPVVWPDTITKYYLTVIDSIGNISYDSVLIDVQVCPGIKEINNADWIKVFPNPANDELYIENNKSTKNHIEIIIFNILGQEIINQRLNGSTRYTLDISELDSGVYFYSIISNGELLKIDKFIKL